MPDWLVSLTRIVNTVDDLIWGIPLIVAILATGILLSVLLRFRHLLHLGNAFRYVFHQDDGHHGEVSAFGALCTALSATIGTGNIVGVATAITTGGPGALFWMEVAALFGMATKYAEGLLAVKYREVAPDGRVLGGPFYYIERGLGSKWKPLAVVFAVFGMGAGLLGIGTLTQVHGIVAAAQRFFDPAFNPADPATGITVLGTVQSPAVMIAGIVVTACVALVVIGGLQRIAKVSMVVVPFMAVSYTLVCLLVMFGNYDKIPAAFMTIVKAAFDPAAVTGGADELLIGVVPLGLVQSLRHLLIRRLGPGVVTKHDLVLHAAQIFHRAFVSADAVGNVMARELGSARKAEDRAVVVQGGHDGGGIACVAVGGQVALNRGENTEGGDLLGGRARGPHNGSQSMGGVVGPGQIVAPVLIKVDVGFGKGGVLGIDGVIVFALRVQDLTQGSAVTEPLHLAVELHMRVVFRQHKDGIRLFIGPHQLDTLGHGAVADALAEHVDSLLKQTDHKGCVLVEEVGHDDRVHVVLNEIVKVIVDRYALVHSLSRPFSAFGMIVANGHDLTALQSKVPHDIHASAYAEYA